MLTPRQENFCLAFIQSQNATEAYRKAFSTKAKTKTVTEYASVLLNTPKIAQRIDELRHELAKPSIMTAQEVLEGLTYHAKKESNLSKDQIKAMELLGKHHKCFTEVIQPQNPDGSPINPNSPPVTVIVKVIPVEPKNGS